MPSTKGKASGTVWAKAKGLRTWVDRIDGSPVSVWPENFKHSLSPERRRHVEKCLKLRCQRGRKRKRFIEKPTETKTILKVVGFGFLFVCFRFCFVGLVWFSENIIRGISGNVLSALFS